jgi:hypothetical protein
MRRLNPVQAISSLFTKCFILQRRKLTSGEQVLARSIFNEQLQLDQVEIVAHRLLLRHYAMSPNGHIYFHPLDYCADFSQLSIEKQSWLIHELTHVWQLQQGMALLRKAVFDRRYAYVLRQGKDFLQYGIEQQAQMVQDYFLALHQGRDCSALASCIPFVR